MQQNTLFLLNELGGKERQGSCLFRLAAWTICWKGLPWQLT